MKREQKLILLQNNLRRSPCNNCSRIVQNKVSPDSDTRCMRCGTSFKERVKDELKRFCDFFINYGMEYP